MRKTNIGTLIFALALCISPEILAASFVPGTVTCGNVLSIKNEKSETGFDGLTVKFIYARSGIGNASLDIKPEDLLGPINGKHVVRLNATNSSQYDRVVTMQQFLSLSAMTTGILINIDAPEESFAKSSIACIGSVATIGSIGAFPYFVGLGNSLSSALSALNAEMKAELADKAALNRDSRITASRQNKVLKSGEIEGGQSTSPSMSTDAAPAQ